MKAQQTSGSLQSASIGVGKLCCTIWMSTPASRNTRVKSARHAASARAPALYMRKDVIIAKGSRELERLPHSHLLRLRQQRGAERDVGDAQAPVPEQDRLVVALAAGLHARDDLSQLGVEVPLVQAVAVDVLAQRAERQSL